MLLFLLGAIAVGVFQIVHCLILTMLYRKNRKILGLLKNYCWGVGFVLLGILLRTYFSAIIPVIILVSFFLAFYFAHITYKVMLYGNTDSNEIPEDFLKEHIDTQD